MNKIRKYIYKKVLQSVLQRPCPLRIPRSGDAGKQVNCYTIEIYNGSDPYLMVEAVDEIGVTGRLWTGQKCDKKGAISFKNLNNFKISINHYYGLNQIKFDGIFDYIIGKILRRPYVWIWINSGIKKLKQFVYNQTDPFRFEKMQILKFLVENHLENDERKMTSWNIMEGICSTKWFGHPKGEQAHKRLLLFLDSLAETCEIKKINLVYKVKGKAIDTLARFALEERRHQENISLKRIMVVLTLFIVILS